MLDPKSPHAESISTLFNITMLMALVIFVIVAGLVVYSIFRFRAGPGRPEPEPVFGHMRLEIAWTAGPIIVVAILFVLTAIAMRASDPAEATGSGAQAPDLVIVGHQWWWEVRYPAAGVTTANEIHIPAGKRVLARLEGADVIHSFWVPELGPKKDMVPGHPNVLYLQADRPGTYPGACSEYCGAEHAWMLLRVIAQAPAEYDSWLAAQQKPPALPTTGPLAAGLQVFRQKTCISCHALGNIGAHVGPDLTHLGSRETLGAGILTNTPDNLTKWLQNPQQVKPQVLMPNVRLTGDEVKALVDYLESLK